MNMKNKIMEWLHLDDMIENGQKYVDAKIELIKIELHEILSNVIAALLIVFTLLFFCLMMIAFLSIALGTFLNEKMNTPYGGYLVMGGIFFILIICLIILLPKIKVRTRLLCSGIINDSTDAFKNISSTKHADYDKQ